MNATPLTSDQAAFSPHYARLKGFFARRVRCQQEAADLTQETYLRVLKSPRREETRHPVRLLFCIARNLLIDRSRHRARQPEFETLVEESLARPDRQTSPAHIAEARDQLALVQTAIAALPPRCREVFILNRFGGLSYPEIAARLGLSPSTVEKHMIRALAACRSALASPATAPGLSGD